MWKATLPITSMGFLRVDCYGVAVCECKGLFGMVCNEWVIAFIDAGADLTVISDQHFRETREKLLHNARSNAQTTVQ